MLSTLIQILKAIHNRKQFVWYYKELYVIYFDTNFESYSQPPHASRTHPHGCMLSTLIQILKAIHNKSQITPLRALVVCYLLWYKFWKLFTTARREEGTFFGCMLSTLIQILKAIHNLFHTFEAVHVVVCYLLWYKFWKLFTTRCLGSIARKRLYVIYFDTNFESYSQHKWQVSSRRLCCMLSTLIQILKAIHNSSSRCFLRI